MSKKKAVMLSIYELIEEITGNDGIFLDYFKGCDHFMDDDLDNLHFVLTKQFIDSLEQKVYDKLSGPALKEMMNAVDEDTKTGIVRIRADLAALICDKQKNHFAKVSLALNHFEKIFCEGNRHPDFSIEKLPRVYDYLLRTPIHPTQWIASNSKRSVARAFIELDKQLDIVRKSILYLYGNKRYPEFFWWLFLFALFQCDIVFFLPHLPNTQYREIINFLALKDRELLEIATKPLVSVQEDVFWDIRRKIIDTASGHLIMMGPSLKNAFDRRHKNNIWSELLRAITKKRLTKVSILITDPIIFNNDYVCSDPKNDIDRTVKSLQEHFYSVFNKYQVELCLYFLPFLQIDHAVITEEFMVFRSNKLWNCDRKNKGAFTLHVSDFYTARTSEYRAQLDYLQVIFSNSTIIYPDVDLDDQLQDPDDARSLHRKWRECLHKSGYTYIFLYKVYSKQIHSYVCRTWRRTNDSSELFVPGGLINEMSDFYDSSNLLDDTTQAVLLPYLKETENMFTEAIKKHDANDDSFCHFYPALDLGFPNNVRRLAGGFATGMLVTWNCGTDMVPVDATVNVCTSSVFKLDQINPDWIENEQLFYDMVDQFAKEASEEKGYSFSFRSGNHFLTIATDTMTGDYYLVIHSSANELKHSYMGLYPVEDNWYSGKIKHINGNNGRYFRYLKDEDARYFIRMAKNFQMYNEQIHQWVAERFNGGPFENKEKWMAHHYYMPTDQSIAIGTFAEPVGTQVPMFSAHGKPMYIFEIGPNNFQVDLGETKGRVCVIPHGWGQKIDGIESITICNNQLVLRVDGAEYQTPISSQEYIRCDKKQLREFDDGYDFLAVGDGYIHGKFIKELIPVIEYSRNTVMKGK